MANDTYTFKEVILGLRPEFIKAKKDLDKLKQYSVHDPKYIDDFDYALSKFLVDEAPELLIYIQRKYQNNLIKGFDELRDIFGHPRKTGAKMVRDNTGIYYPLTNEKNFPYVNRDQYQEFKELAEQILSSDFAQKMNFSEISSPNKYDIIRLSGIMYNLRLTTLEQTTNCQFDYLGNQDKFGFYGGKTTLLTEEYLDYLLDREFPREEFSEYHQALIDEHLGDDTDIVLPENCEPLKSCQLNIEDDGKKLILIREPLKRSWN